MTSDASTPLFRRLPRRGAHCILRRTGLFIMAERYRRACSEADELLPKIYPDVAEYLALHIQEGGRNYPNSSFKLLELCRLLDRLRPATILELGSGTTTAAFAHYALRHEEVRVFSVDNSAEYIEETRHRLGEALSARVEPVLAERVVTTSDPDARGEEVCHYDDSAYAVSDAFDLVYVDGPYAVSPTRDDVLMPCIDATRTLRQGKTVQHIVFDNRFTSLRHLLRSGEAHSYSRALRAGADPDEVWPVHDIRHHSMFSL